MLCALLVLLVGMPLLLHASTDRLLLLAPDPARVQDGTAFYEVVFPSGLSVDNQRALAFKERRSLEQTDSLRLEKRFREQQHLVGDLLDVLRDLRKEMRKSHPEQAHTFPEGSLDSVRTFLEIENRDSLMRARVEIDLAPFATKPYRRLLIGNLQHRKSVDSRRSHPEISFSGVNGPLIQHLRYLEWCGFRLEEEIVSKLQLLHGSPKQKKWHEELLKSAGKAVEEREYRRAIHLTRLVKASQWGGSETFYAFGSYTGRLSGDVHPEEAPWGVPPASMNSLTLPGDSLLRNSPDVHLENGVRTFGYDHCEESIAWLERVPLESSQGPTAALLLAKQYRQEGRTGNARAALEAIANQMPNLYNDEARDQYAQVLIALGDLLAEAGELQRAVDSWQRVDRHSRYHAQATLKAGWVALNRGNLAAVRDWAESVADQQGETPSGYEAAVLFDLAGGDRDHLAERLEQLNQLDHFLAALNNLETAEGLLASLDAMHDDVVINGANGDIAELHRLERISGKVQTASVLAAANHAPSGLRFDGLSPHLTLHPFEEEQLEDESVREAQLRELLRSIDQLAHRIEQWIPAPPEDDWKWVDRLKTARLIRDQQDDAVEERFKAERWREPLTRLRLVLRTTLLFDDNRYQFNPKSVPGRESVQQAEAIEHRVKLLLNSGQPASFEAAAQGLLWCGDLYRNAANTVDGDLLGRAISCYRAIDTLSVPSELKALALDRLAAMDLVAGDHQRLQRVRATVDTIRARYPASAVLAHADLLAAEAWMSEKRPQYDDALLDLESALYRPDNPFRNETLYLTGWCALRLHDVDRERAIRAFDQALMIGEMRDEQRLRQELIRELAGAFAPPFVENADAGFALAEEFFRRKWKRVPEYGFEFYLKLGDLYLSELGDEKAATRAFQICRTDFRGEEYHLRLDLTRVRLEDKEDGNPLEAFERRLELANQSRELDRTSPELDSLLVQRLVEAVSLAASEVSKGGDSSWVGHLNRATDLMARMGKPQERIARALFLRAATLERFAGSSTSSKTLLAYYRTIALSYPSSEVARPSMQRAFALLYDALGKQKGENPTPLNPAELTHIALLLADRFPDDARTPSLLLHAAASTSGGSSDALLDTIAVRFPGSDSALNANKLWFKRKLAGKYYEAVSRRALGLLAESPGRKLREVAAGAYAQASYELAMPHAQAGNVDKALQLYRRGAEVGKGSELAPTLLYQAGLLAAETGRKEEARGFFQELVDWYPDSPSAASASFNLALTLGQLKGGELLGSPDEAGPEEIARAFEDAYRSDSTSTHAATFLANAAENYRVAGMPYNELRNRLTLLRLFPEKSTAYSNAVRCLELAATQERGPAISTSAQFLVNHYPDSAQTIVAWYRLGMLGDDPAPFQHAIELQQALEKSSTPGLPAFADAARVALIDMDAAAQISWKPRGQLLEKATINNQLENINKLYESYRSYGNLPSTAGVLARAHLACLLIAEGQSLVNSTGFNPSQPGGVEAVAGYEAALERSFVLHSEALEHITSARRQLEELDRQHQQLARNSRVEQPEADPFGLRLLGEYLPVGKSAGSMLTVWEDSLRAVMAHRVLDAAYGYHRISSRVEGDPLESLLVQLESMRTIIGPRLAIATSLLGESANHGPEPFYHRSLVNRLPALYADSVALDRLDNFLAPRQNALIADVLSPGRKAPGVLKAMQQRADFLNDLQDAIVSTVDEGTLLLAQVYDSLGHLAAVDSLILDRVSNLLWIADRFDRAAERCARELIDLESRAGKSPTKAMNIGQALLRDQKRAWNDGAIRVLESIWVLIKLESYANNEHVHRLARELVIHDPAGYADLFDLPHGRTVVLSDKSWYFTVDGKGVLDRVGIEQGRWQEPNPGVPVPKMIQASFPGDTLVAETSLDLEGLVVAATLEITASCRYEVFVNGSYVAESLHSPDLTGVPDVWELRTQLSSGHNSVRILLEDDRPVAMMARIIYTTIPEPKPGMEIRTGSSYGGRE